MASHIITACPCFAAGSCVADFGEYSSLSQPTYINQYNTCTPHIGAPGNCTWYAADRVQQLTGIDLNIYQSAWGDGGEWYNTAARHNFPVYNGSAEALQAFGTLAGLVISFGGGIKAGFTTHVAVVEKYNEDGSAWVSEMWGLESSTYRVRITSYSVSELASTAMHYIDFSSIGLGPGAGGGGYFKDKFGEFHWPVKPEKDARFPTSSEYQEFCDRLNEAQEEAGVENPTKFSAEQDNNVLTAARFNEYLHLMQTSDEGTLKGVDDEVELMDDVKKDDVIYAKHFLQLEDLYNHWMYGNNFLVDDNSVPGQIWNFYMMKGYSPIVTAGLIGYIGWESTFDPTIDEIGNGIGYGLCQWSFSRRNDLINWCNSHGFDYRTVQGQLEYMYYEIEVKDTLFHEYCTYGCHAAVCGGYHEGIGGLAGFKNLKDIYEVVWCFTWWWGRPGVPRIEERYEIAQTYYTKFYINNPGAGGSGGIAGVGDLQWPSDTPQWCTYGSHYGLDIQASYGTPIYASAAGTVLWAGWSWETTYGYYVRIYHPEFGIQTAYAHQSRVATSVGATVSKGQIIGYVGSSGNSTGPHIHYELYENASNQMHTGSIIYDNIWAWSKYYDYNWLSGNQVPCRS